MIRLDITTDGETKEVSVNEEHILAVESADDGRAMVLMLTGMMYKADQTAKQVLERIDRANAVRR